MYEYELRSLIDNFQEMKLKLDTETSFVNEEREVTIFFINPNKNDFELRLRFTKNNKILSYKEGISKKARKEIEVNIEDIDKYFEILLRIGLEVKHVIKRHKYNYRDGEYNILLNCIHGWGDALEIDFLSDKKLDGDLVYSSLEKYLSSKLGIKHILSNEELVKRNKEYASCNDFTNISINDLLKYINY